jgi:hypothetical protein
MGAPVVTADETRFIAPGTYFARLSQIGRSRITRVVPLH